MLWVFGILHALLSINQYDIGRRGCALMSSLLKANWDRQTARQTGTSNYRDACASKNEYLKRTVYLITAYLQFSDTLFFSGTQFSNTHYL
jgi:hypothetical protein